MNFIQPMLLKRAMRNTTRCLVGCSIGDLGALFIIQTQFPTLPMQIQMPICVVSGLATSLALETVYLKKTEQGMSWKQAGEVAFGMSFISMTSMEVAMTLTEQHLTAGVFDPSSANWWASVSLSLFAGFVTSLPYSYYQLRKHGKSCCRSTKQIING